jgi:hypothetical protein
MACRTGDSRLWMMKTSERTGGMDRQALPALEAAPLLPSHDV